MEVLAHPDPFVLEAELLERIAAAQHDDPFAPVLVVVPTRRLASHVARRIAEHAGARLAVETTDHRSLALRALAARGGFPLRIAPPAILEELVHRAAASLREGALRRFLEARPGARRALGETFRDLRDAGIEPAALLQAAPGTERELAAGYAAYVRELAGLAAHGLSDEAGLVAAALPRLGLLAAGYRAIFHHGAYELIGVHLDLVRALDAARPLVFLLPCDPGGKASVTATTFASEFLTRGAEPLSRLADRPAGLLGARLAALYDESAAPPALADGTVRFHHAQGARAELTLAARLALRAVAMDGVPPHEIAIVARTLAPYSAAIEEVLDAEGIPWSGPLDAPLRRRPVIHDLLLLLRVVGEDFPREPTAELLASPRLAWEALAPSETAPVGDLAERWSRRAGIVSGLDAWRRDLPAGARTPDRRRDAERMGRALSALTLAIEPSRKRRWTMHAELVARVLRTCLVLRPGIAEDEAALGELAGMLESLKDLERALGDVREVSLLEMVERLERWVNDARLPLRASDEGGIRVLDAMQARGLTFRRVFLIGMHAGLFPRAARADTFLDDEVRAELRRSGARPISRKADGEAEERILLSMTLGSCAEALAVSWQRSDDAGKARTASIALREVARVTLGAADLDLLVHRTAHGIPVHPEQALERLAAETGMLAPTEAALLGALRSTSPDEALGRLGARSRGLEAGLALVAATERSEAPDDARYDGSCAPRAVAFAPSVSALQLLGHCPLRYFFRYVLHVDELEEEADPFAVDSREMGDRVHAVLERAFSALFDEGLLAPGRGADTRARIATLIPELWGEVNRDLVERLARRVPVLWMHLCDLWVPALLAFVTSESTRLAGDGVESIEVETRRTETLDFGAGVHFDVTGRFDRIVRTPAAQTRVSDYKTGRDLARFVTMAAVLKGLELQAPLYRMLAGGNATVEFLGVGPEHPQDQDDPPIKSFDGFAKPAEEAGFRETVRVLAALVESGRFPMRPDERRCARCSYRRACRYNHPPTISRHDSDVELADFHTLGTKSSRKPGLA